jgi:hypothetical protein
MSDAVTIMNQNGNVIAAAPKLALVVVSSVFRDFFETNSEAKGCKIPSSVDDAAVVALVAWLKAITTSVGKFGVSLPNSNEDLIKTRHAAYTLGMELYVRHFCKAYKDDLRNRTSSMVECDIAERIALEPVDDLLIALGERLAYLRRRREFNENSIAKLAEFLKTHPKLAQSVNAADTRAALARYRESA